MQQSNIFGRQGILGSWLPARYISNESVELKTDNDVVRFSLDKSDDINSTEKNQKNKKVKMSKKAKVNELRFYRLKAKKKMNSPNPEVRIRYKLEKVRFRCNFKFYFKALFTATKLSPLLIIYFYDFILNVFGHAPVF